MSGVIRVLLERPWIALALALVIETVVLVIGQNDMVVADPLWYSKVAHDIAIDPSGVFTAPETHPFVMRVGLTLPLALFYKLFGVSLFVSNLPVLLAGLGVLLVVYAAAPTPRAKLIGLALCIACTPLLHFATVLGCDLPCATLMAASVLWLARRDRPRGSAWLVAAVGAWFAAFLVKESAIWLAPVWIYAILRDGLDHGVRATLRTYAAALGVGAVLGAAYLMICGFVWGDPLARFHGIDDLTTEHTWSMVGKPASAWLARLTYQPLQMFIEMFSIALIPVALSPWLVRERDRLWVVAAASTIGLFWFGSSSLTAYAPLPISQRMALQALPPILVVAAIATDNALERWSHLRTKLGVAIGIVALLFVPYVRAVMTQLRRGHPEAAAYAELRHEVLDLHRHVVLVCGEPRCTSIANFYFDFAIPPNLTVVLATDFARFERPADAIVRAIVNVTRSAGARSQDPHSEMSREIIAAHLPTLYESRDIKLYDAGDGVALNSALQSTPVAKPGVPLKPLPVPKLGPPPGDPAVSLSTSSAMTCAILASGAVTCWGGAFGTPHRIAGWTDIAKLAMPEDELCGLHRDGHVECADIKPKLDGTTVAALDLHTIGGNTTAIDLAANGDALCVLDKSGDVACRVDEPAFSRTQIHHASALVVGNLIGPDWQFPNVSYACAIVGDNLECIDIYLQAQQTAVDPRPVDRYLAPVGTKPKLWLGAPHVVFRHVTTVSAAPLGLCAGPTGAAATCVSLHPDMTTTAADPVTPSCTHTETSISCTYPPVNPFNFALDHVTQIKEGISHSCAIYGGGAVACWGNDDEGQLGRGVAKGVNTMPAWGLDDAIDIVSWTYGVVALRANGQLAYWGHGDGGSSIAIETSIPITLSDITDATRIVSGHFHVCVLRRTGNVACWGHDSVPTLAPDKPTDIPGLHDIRELTATDFGLLARTADGTLLHVGDPMLGPSAAKTPTPIKTAEHAAAVVITSGWVCVLDHTAGPVRCWTENEKTKSAELLVVTDAVEIVGSGRNFPEVDTRAKLLARLGDGRTVAIALEVKDGQPVATTTELAKVTRSVFASTYILCARGATGTTCTSADRMDPPTIPHAYDNARAFTAASPTCALTAAGSVVCFANTDLFTDGTGRGVSTVPVPIAL